MRLFGLIGHPLTQSFSKSFFTRKFEKDGLGDCRYELFPLTSLESLPGLIKLNPQLEGLNVTVPYKQEVLPYLDTVDNIPSTLNACNCIRIVNGMLHGFNTDHFAFEKSISPHLQPQHRKAIVLGNGGAAAAVLFVLKKLGIETSIVSRQLHEGSTHTYADLNEKLIHEHLLIINTTPVGMYPNNDECPAIPYNFITRKHLLFDLVYNPSKTLFLQQGEEQGATIMNGQEMLELQAEESWRIWNS